jgi:hypothetical protein
MLYSIRLGKSKKNDILREYDAAYYSGVIFGKNHRQNEPNLFG